MKQPIGVIDSGVGGLTVAREIMRQLPKEEILYVGDTLRCPYGPRPKEEVIKYTWQMVNFLLTKNIKLLVVACNTATAFTLGQLQEKLDIPVIGVIQPGARTAIKVTKTAHIGVIGTEGTISSKAYLEALHSINSSINVYGLACPEFVPLVEMGINSGAEAQNTVNKLLEPLTTIREMDTLILGCTHYPLIQDLIQSKMGDKVTIICSSDETAREVSTILDHYQLLNQEEAAGATHNFYTTGDKKLFQEIASQWFGRPIMEVSGLEFK